MHLTQAFDRLSAQAQRSPREVVDRHQAILAHSETVRSRDQSNAPERERSTVPIPDTAPSLFAQPEHEH